MCIQRFDRKKNRIEAAAETEKKSVVWFTPLHFCFEKSIYSPNFIQILSHCCTKKTRNLEKVKSACLKRQLLVLVFMKCEEEKTTLFEFSAKMTYYVRLGRSFVEGAKIIGASLGSLSCFFCNTISKFKP